MGTYVDQQWPGNPAAQTRAERRGCRYRAYLPDPLHGRDIALTASTAADIADVERAVLALQSTHPRMVSLEPVARLLLRAEAVASSFIEGFQVNVRRLAKEEASQRSGLGSHDETARAVLGNVAAMESALALADLDRPITVDDVRQLHARLLSGTRDERWGGVIRNEQNWIGGTGLSPCTAQFVPPPPQRVEQLLKDFCEYASGDDHPALVQAALVHAQFETIHPFLDGNGRTGRALIHVVLRRRGLATRFVPPISLILATHADAYVAGLTTYRYEGPPSREAARRGIIEWLELFLADTARACADAGQFAGRLEQLESDWRHKVGKIRRGSSADLLISSLVGAPVITGQTAAALVGRAIPNSNRAINRLVEAGILVQTTVGRRNRAFEAPELVELVTGFERALVSPVGDTLTQPPVRPVPQGAERLRERLLDDGYAALAKTLNHDELEDTRTARRRYVQRTERRAPRA